MRMPPAPSRSRRRAPRPAGWPPAPRWAWRRWGGSTRAYLGDFTRVGQTSGKAINDLTVTAHSGATTTVEVQAVAAGIGAGSGNRADAVFDPAVQASTGLSSVLTVTGGVTIVAGSTPKMDAQGLGVNAGGFTVGVSLATAEAKPTLN